MKHEKKGKSTHEELFSIQSKIHFPLFLFLSFSFSLLYQKHGSHRLMQITSKHHKQVSQENTSKNPLIKEAPPKEGK